MSKKVQFKNEFGLFLHKIKCFLISASIHQSQRNAIHFRLYPNKYRLDIRTDPDAWTSCDEYCSKRPYFEYP